jgi:hypothetical protein
MAHFVLKCNKEYLFFYTSKTDCTHTHRHTHHLLHLFQGSTRHNSSLSHYGGPFGDEGQQTCMPSCMSRMHGNYSWTSKAVPGAEVCNRDDPCSVLHRKSSNVAKLDRTGQVVESGLTAMESAVVQHGGRAPDSVPKGGGGGGSVCSMISACYINSSGHHGNRAGPAASSAAGGGGGGGGGASSFGSSVHGRYTYIDEEYLRCLQSQMLWDRDNGIVHLMPIAVVYQGDVC